MNKVLLTILEKNMEKIKISIEDRQKYIDIQPNILMNLIGEWGILNFSSRRLIKNINISNKYAKFLIQKFNLQILHLLENPNADINDIKEILNPNKIQEEDNHNADYNNHNADESDDENKDENLPNQSFLAINEYYENKNNNTDDEDMDDIDMDEEDMDSIDIDDETLQYNISKHPNISIKDIENNPDLPWDPVIVTICNPNATYEYYNNNKEKLSALKINHLDFIKEEHIIINENIIDNKKIDYNNLSSNSNISLKFVAERQNSLIYNWDWSQLSRILKFTEEEFYKYQHLNWRFSNLSINPNITMKIILNNLHQNINFMSLSYNLAITIKDIENYPNLPWNWNNISHNPNINMKFVLKNLDKEWNWNTLSFHSNITMEDIDNNIDLPWSWVDVFNNPNMTEQYVKKFMETKYIKKMTQYEKCDLFKSLSENIYLYDKTVCEKNIKNSILNRINLLHKVVNKVNNLSNLENIMYGIIDFTYYN